MLDKTYEPKPVEEKWLKAWLAADLFHSTPRSGKKDTFTVVIPPPNITGALHMGHALNDTLQDVLVRWQKMLGREACWVPGTDHGGIATQNVMEKLLKAEKVNRHELGRDKFLERMQVWSRDTKQTILGQLKRLGCALDWRREAFTMDEARSKAVTTAFVELFAQGSIYRGERMINWCVRCHTALSDIEVEHEDRKGHLWYIHYPAESGGEGIVVATTRPETMLGDTAVAVPVDSEKWKRLIGKRVKLPLTDRSIPVVADEAVDAAFGEGAVKVTPAHDPKDFEIAQRHDLPSVKVIGFDGKITENAPNYLGLTREKAREEVVKALEAAGLLRKTEPYAHAVPICYRCSQVVEPLVSNQWFVKMESLAAPAIEAAESGKVRFHPESWKKPYVEWLKNVKDWCISRQIWWGHRIPVWYCLRCDADRIPAIGSSAGTVDPAGAMSKPKMRILSLAENMTMLPGVTPLVNPAKHGEPPEKCPKCGLSDELAQDPDVLDTWFSSALWPFSVFGWPEKTKDLEFYYPTSVLVTGYEILYLWVSRMQMMGIHFLGEAPFTDVFIHGIVRDRHGKKMSKSLGNVVDPLVLMDKFGTDAMRFALASQSGQGRDIPFSEDGVLGARNFTNKLWNTARFVLMNLPSADAYRSPLEKHSASPAALELCDVWILHEYRAAVREARARMEQMDPAGAADILYGFLWDRFCDWYVELAKLRLQSTDDAVKDVPRAILVEVLAGMLKLLHPFMPYVTEELWREIGPYSGGHKDFLLHERLPISDGKAPAAQDPRMTVVMEVTRAIRTIRSQFNVPPGLQIDALYSPKDNAQAETLAAHGAYVRHLARLKDLKANPNGKKPPHSATAVVGGLVLYVPLEGIIDLDKERARLGRELEAVKEELGKLDAKLSRDDFRARAPKAEVEKAVARKEEVEAKRRELETQLDAI